MHIQYTKLNEEYLSKLSQGLSQSDIAVCKRMFGRIMDLIEIPVDWNMIKAIMWFWDSERRCFVINDEDFCPIAEEYEAIFQGSVTRIRKCYGPFNNVNQKRQFSRFLGIKVPDVEPYISGESGITIRALIKLCDELMLKYGARDFKLKTFVMAVFGLALFPKVTDMIDLHLFDLIFGVWSEKINPIYSILAETIATFNKLTKTGQGTFTACPQLFQVWVCQHFVEAFVSIPTYFQANPALTMKKAKERQRDIEEWKTYFNQVPQIRWFAGYMNTNAAD